MAEGLALGSAFFNFSLGMEGFARGSARLISTVANTAGAVSPQAGKIGDSFAKIDDKLGGVMRSTERFSRGLRGISPEVAAAKEQVYRYENSLKGLQEQIEITKIRVAERTRAEQANQEQITKSRQAIEQYRTSIEHLQQRLTQEVATLTAMQQSGTASRQDLIRQRDAVDGLDKAITKLIGAQSREQKTLDQAEGSTRRLALSRERAEHTLAQQQQSESRYSSLLDLAQSRIAKVSERIKERAEKQRAAKASADALAQADGRHASLLDRLFGLFHKNSQAINTFSASSQRAIGIQQGFNAAMMRTSTVMRDIAVGAVGSFIGNTLSSLTTGFMSSGSAALQSYKSHELLGKSLQALSARELVASGKFRDLAAAQESAGKQSQAMIKWMQDLAVQSPFSVDDISGAFRLGNALGFTSSQMQRLIRDTTDWASATGASGQQIKSVIRAMGQMHNTGHVTLEDLNQMTDAGMSARDILRDEFAPEIRASKKSLEDLISDGVLPADRAINALTSALQRDFGRMPGFDHANEIIKRIGETGRITFNDIGALGSSGLSLEKSIPYFEKWGIKTEAQLRDALTNGIIPATDAVRILGSEVVQQLGGGADKTANSMAGLLNSISDLKNSALREFFSKTFEVVQPMISQIVGVLGSPETIASIRGFGEMIGNKVGQALNWLGTEVFPVIIRAAQSFGPVILDAFGAITAIAQEAYTWGYNIGAMFQQGLADTIDAIVNTITWIGSVISEWMEPHSPPKFLPELDVWGKKTFETWLGGAEASDVDKHVGSFGRKVKKALDPRAMSLKERGIDSINAYFQGWSSGDLSLFDNLGQQVSDALKAVVDAGGMSESGLVPAILGTDDAIKSAVDEMVRTGSVSSAAFDRIRNAAGPAGERVSAYAEAVIRSELANRRLKAAQEELTAVTKKYDDQLRPLQERLNALHASGEKSDRDKQLARLRQMAERYQQLGMTRQLAAVEREINKISLEDQISKIEQEKAAATDAAQQKVDAAQQAADAAAQQMDMQQQQIELQKKQNELIQKQIDLLTGKDDETTKTKQATDALKEQEKLKKKQEAEEKKRATEAERLWKSELDMRLAAANSEQERLQILQEAQSHYNAGTKEYIDMQRRIEVQQNKAEAETQKQANAVQKLSDAEFEAQLATQDRAGKISMLKDRLGGLTQGTLEYEKTLKRLNALEFSEARAGGAGGSKLKGLKGKGGPGIGGSPLKGLDQVGDTMGKVGDATNKVTDAVNRARESFGKFQEKIKPFFDFLNQNSGVIAFVIQKLMMSFLIGFAIEKALKPLLGFIWGLRQFITWGNAFWVLLTFLGYAWKTNLGGLRDIVSEVWAAIQKPLESIKTIIKEVADAFSKDGLSGALDVLWQRLPELGTNIANIGVIIFNGVKKWTQPFIDGMAKSIDGVITWIQGGGINRIGEKIKEYFVNLFSGANQDGLFSSGMIASGLLGLIGGVPMVMQGFIGAISEQSGVLYDALRQLWDGGIKYLSDNLPAIVNGASAALAVGLYGLLKGLVPLVKVLWKGILDVGGLIIEMLPSVITVLGDLLLSIVAWAQTDGLPMLVEMLADLFDQLGESLPKLGLNLGRVVGQLLTKIWMVGLAIMTTVNSEEFHKKVNDIIVNKLWPAIKRFSAGFVGFFIGILAGLLIGIADPIITALRGVLIGAATGLKDNINKMLEPIVQGISEWLDKIRNFLVNGPGKWIDLIIPGFTGMAVAIIDGLKNGLKDGAVGLIQTIVDMFDWMVSGVKQFLGIASPSTLFMDIAANIVDGLRAGMEFIHQLWTDVLTWLGTFITDFIAAVLKWEDDILIGIDLFVTRFMKFMTDLTLKVIDIFVNFFADILGKFGVNRDAVLAVVTDLRDKVITAWTYISTEATRIFNEVLTTIGTWVGNVKNFFTGEGGIVGIITGAWTSITDSVATFGTTLAESFSSAISSAKTALVNGLNDMIDVANDAIDSLNAIADKVGLGHLSHIPKIYLALGTQYAPGGMAVVGEEGPELVNLPRGASVTPASRTLAMFQDAAKDMITQVLTVVQSATQSIEQASTQAAQALMQAAQQDQRAVDAGRQVIVTNNVTTTNERHDHWNLTVNTKAEAPTVVSDFATMRAIAGV